MAENSQTQVSAKEDVGDGQQRKKCSFGNDFIVISEFSEHEVCHNMHGICVANQIRGQSLFL